jgi:uncharacterized membrane protein YeiH
MAILFTIFEFVGTVSFAISGAMEAIRHKMDLFGVIMLGVITACGGGILRDIVIGVIPPRVFQNPKWAILAIIISLLAFIILRFSKAALQHFVRLREAMYFLADTGGLAAFTVLGIESAGEGNMALLLFVGMITGVGGGVLRDVLAGTVPSIFRKHIYALASAAGALTDILLMRIVPHEVAMLAGFCVVVLIRVLASHFHWNLPHIE